MFENIFYSTQNNVSFHLLGGGIFSTKIYPKKILLLIFGRKNSPPPPSEIKRCFGYPEKEEIPQKVGN